MRIVFYILYYFFARHLPASYRPYALGAKNIRYWICRHLFSKCGKNVNIEHGAYFGSGKDVEIGDNSGIGVDCFVGRAIIGKDVMMGPEVILLGQNHKFDDLTVPMFKQGYLVTKPVEIGDDVWIGTRVIILPGRKIGKGSVIGAGAVVTKDIPEYAVAAGNPARVIRFRGQQEQKDTQ